jgi:hypothetical protein
MATTNISVRCEPGFGARVRPGKDIRIRFQLAFKMSILPEACDIIPA